MLFLKLGQEASLEKLIQQVKNGNVKAFGAIYNTLVEKLYRFIYFKVDSRETAEDLTQAVFLKVLEGINKYQEKSSFLAWVYTIARNQVIDHYRTKKSHAGLDQAEKIEFSDKNLSLEEKEQRQEIYKALRRLTKEEREVVELHSIDEFNFEEISQIVGKTPGSLRVLKYRALIKLRKFLNQ
jgi:RNA polymerase sigma-70 factor (ECF subfamily)